MAKVDSVDKIVQRYFACVALQQFIYKSYVIVPKSLWVSQGIFVRKMTCVAKCGACCSRFSLDCIPNEINSLSQESRERLSKRLIDFDGRSIEIWFDMQLDHDSHFCRNLNMQDGRCGIHGSHPFSCDFELLRFFQFEGSSPNRLSHSPFGRGWAMKRIDGDRGALCEWYESPCDREWVDEIIRKIKRLKDWTDHFGLNTTLPGIIDWVDRGPHTKPLVIGPESKKGFNV